ncbi:GNAT family N-acetyltransferase [Arthrobacter sp. MYb227]|uniref:GNAT family N-acetyltransferase n=1 Tax=Arthrobacter sp. MYb227 TaxID=1848601 RepID=UPI000CFDEE70|nr:GNAT family N-acetyltransferase [Arthrobacter sp. MYb227]PQZ93718.1 GNAT family N-acetyltransferase [Arthrobacter sp. MYb227]
MIIDRVEIRVATAEDAAALFDLANMFTPGLETSVSEFEAHFRSLLKGSSWLVAVAEDGGRLTGYVAAQDYGRGLRGSFTVGRIHDLFVDPNARESGIGRSLVKFAFEWAKARPLPMILDWQATPGSVSFYESLGFEADRVGDFPEYPGFTLDLRSANT